jgi:hypothetical protein
MKVLYTAAPSRRRRQLSGVARCANNRIAVACSSLEGSQWDGSLVFLDLTSASPDSLAVVGGELQLGCGVSSVAWCRAHDVVVAGLDDGDAVVVVPPSPLSPPSIVTRLAHHDAPVSAVAAACGGSRVYTASLDGSVACWDLQLTDGGGGRSLTPTAVLRPSHASPALCLATSSTGGDGVAVGYKDGRVLLWYPEAGRVTPSLVGRCATAVRSVAFDEEGAGTGAGARAGAGAAAPPPRTVVYAGLEDGTLLVSFGGKPFQVLARHRLPICALHLDGRSGVLAVGCDDGSVTALELVHQRPQQVTQARGAAGARRRDGEDDDGDDDEQQQAGGGQPPHSGVAATVLWRHRPHTDYVTGVCIIAREAAASEAREAGRARMVVGEEGEGDVGEAAEEGEGSPFLSLVSCGFDGKVVVS